MKFLKRGMKTILQKAAPPRTSKESKVCAAYNSDKGCPDGGNCHMVKKKVRKVVNVNVSVSK
eukprot:3698867-Amphidinium_carterae.1